MEFAATVTATVHTPRADGPKVLRALDVEVLPAVEEDPRAEALHLPDKPLVGSSHYADSVAELRKRVESKMRSLGESARLEAEAHLDSLTLLRFLLARQAIADAESMFVNTMEWRADRKVTALFEELHPSHWHRPPLESRRVALTAAHFYGGYGGKQKSGLPFFVERLGSADLAGYTAHPSVRDVMLDAYVAYMELTLRTVRQATCDQGVMVRGLLVIDASGARWSSLRHLGLLQAASKIAVAHYPELYEPIVIVNAPSVVATAWNFFKPFIPSETRKKISIVASHRTLTALSEHIAPEQIPSWLRGEQASCSSTSTAEISWLPRAERVEG